MRAVCLAVLLCLPGLAAGAKMRGPDYALLCQFEVNPAGSYEYPAGVSAPVVVPGAGGTQAGADALNACIRRKAAASSIPVSVTLPSGAVKTSRRVGDMVSTTYSLGYGTTTRPQAVPSADRFTNRMGTCGLTFSGGSGYRCADTAHRY